MTITRFRKGQLSVPRLYCEHLDTLGGSMYIYKDGSYKFIIDTNVVQSTVNLKLANNRELTDGGNNVTIASDNSGHIDQLGRVDVALTTPADGHEVVVTPAEVVNASQSGTIDEVAGSWTITADDTLYMFIGQLLNFKHVNATIRIDSIIVHFNTNHNDVHILNTYLRTIARTTGGGATAKEDNTSYGDGETGNDSYEMDVDVTLLTNYAYQVKIICESTAGTLIIRALTIKYHLV